MELADVDPGSFRDPSGQVFVVNGRVLRTVNPSIAADFDFVQQSGLFDELTEKGWLIGFEPADPALLGPAGARATYVLEHPRLPLVSYPYEWPFAALKAAALLHLDVHLAALARGVTLSDATAYNIQFIGTRPVFIDILSFVRYQEGKPWLGHRQFCEQFLNPLLLQAYLDVPHNTVYRGAMEGIPVEVMAALLPWRRKLSLRTFMHVVLQSRFQKQASSTGPTETKAKSVKIPKVAIERMLKGLRTWIAGLEPKRGQKTTWESYANETSYSDKETKDKRSFIVDFTRKTGVKEVWDLGCNSGDYLIAALEAGADYGVGFDFDQGALDAGWARARANDLPLQFLFLDATNPSPDQGWAQKERKGLANRRSADGVIALALVHHLAIAKNIPLEAVIDWLVGLAPNGVIEFVPKGDAMVQELLRLREDIFADYDEDTFRAHLEARAKIIQAQKVSVSGRTLYWFERS